MLEIDKASGTGMALPPPTRLELRSYRDNATGSAISDFNPQNVSEGDGRYRSEPLHQGSYRFVLTRHVFEVVNGEENIKLALLPNIKSTAAHRVILEGGQQPGSNLQLKIYFTKP
ncbi:MAG: hypothetical protein U5L96_00035 [Owenweeksia sp.]|nr:hypothetical protein [Owenweeksia sp.]